MAYSSGTGNVGSVQSMGNRNQPASPTQDLISEAMYAAYPQLASGYLTEQGLQQQIGLIGPTLQSQEAYNQAMSGYQGQNLALSEQALGIQQGALGQKGQQMAAQQGFEQQQWGLEQQQYGLQQGQYPEQRAEAALAYQNALMQTQGAQAIGGTQNTVGGRAAVNTLGQQYGFQQQDINRAQALSQLSQQSAQIGQQAEVSGYGYQQQQLQNAAANLRLNAQANGISEQQLLTMLNYGQQQAGLGAQQSAISLYGQLGQAQLGQFATAAQALSNVGFKGAGINTLAGIG